MQSLGFGQAWQNVTASRALGVTYYNATGRPREIRYTVSTAAIHTINVNGVAIVSCGGTTSASFAMGALIPVDGNYSITSTAGGSPIIWAELG
jgi:hypothetical protein